MVAWATAVPGCVGPPGRADAEEPAERAQSGRSCCRVDPIVRAAGCQRADCPAHPSCRSTRAGQSVM